MRAGFEYYRSFPQDAKDNKELAATAKLTMPVLVLSGDIYPALLGGHRSGTPTLSSTQPLATNVHGYHSSTFRALDSRRAAQFCSRPAIKFFGNSTKRMIHRYGILLLFYTKDHLDLFV